MKCTIPEISWHNRDPVLSIDIQPNENEEFYRLASGGYDCHVLIWHLKVQENGAVNQEIVSDLTRHQRAVNVVRWSPSGQYLASGDDDANIILWTLKTDNIPLLEGDTSDKEIWIVHKVLRGHKEDVYDICWAPNGLKLISGSIDNTSILWDFTKATNECILSDHKGFVQGVTWDPKGQYIATLCSDRICRVFDNTGKRVIARAYKGILPLPESHVLYNKEIRYFHDDTFKSYFRRLNFSPDGSLLIAPSGCIESEEFKSIRNTTLVFTLDCLTQPAAILPSPKQVTIAVRCCPLLFELRSDGVDPIIALPYRMVIAVATDTDVILYDTQQLAPFAHYQRIHYTRITDLTWSPDGLLLIASSTDGYCTMVVFEPDELGIQYVKEESEVEESILEVSTCEEVDKNNSVSTKSADKELLEVKAKKPTILEQWAVRKTKMETLKENKKQDNTTRSEEEPMEVDTNKKSVPVNQKVPKRIVPIKIGETKTTLENSKKQDNTTSKEPVEVDPNTKHEPVNQKIPKRIIPIKIGEVEHMKKNNKSNSIEKVVQKTVEDKPTETSKKELLTINPSDEDLTLSKQINNKNEQQEVENEVQKSKSIENEDKKEVAVVDLTDDTSNSPKKNKLTPTKSSTKNDNKKGQLSETPPSKKRKLDKKNHKTITSSPLLRFFQPISKSDSLSGNKSNVLSKPVSKESTSKDVIEVSDDEASRNKDEIKLKMKYSNIITKELKVRLERCTIVGTKIDSSKTKDISNSNQQKIGHTAKENAPEKDTETNNTSVKDHKEDSNPNTEKGDSKNESTKIEVLSNPNENKENLEINSQNNPSLEKEETNAAVSHCKNEPSENNADISSTEHLINKNETEKMETEDIIIGSCNKQQETEDIIIGGCSKQQDPDNKNTQQLNGGTFVSNSSSIKTKVARRVALITLSSPKREKKTRDVTIE